MNVLVTGGAGYLGAVLLPKLLARGHRVRVLDLGYFGVGHLRALQPAVEIIREDIRKACSDRAFLQKLLEGCDCIIHLAAVSNDPSADLDPKLTNEVNSSTTRVLAQAARERKMKFLFSSSCSVYGETDGEVSEEGRLDPITTYAVSKVNAEKALQEMAGSAWKPVILRNGTLFGYSLRMRFDLVVNIFSLYSALHNEIKVFGAGEHWRPFVHVNDCARAFVYFAEKPQLRHICYNIAHQNLRVADLADIFQRVNPRLKVNRLGLPEQDRRDYRVSLRKMQEEGFRTRIDVEMGAEEMIEAIINGLIPDPESVYYRNAKWLQELTEMASKNPGEVVSLVDLLTKSRLHIEK